MNIAEALAETPVSDLDLSRYVAVPRSASVAETTAAMSDAARSVAIVLEGECPVGIFTQRDVLTRVIGRPATWDRPIADEMTAKLRTMRDDGSVEEGLAIMNDWWVRSVPVLASDGGLAGNLSFYVVMQKMTELLGSRIAAANPEMRYGLTMIDFTGLNTSPPVSVAPSDTVATAAHQMRVRGIGSVLVVDDRERLVGVLTEFDLQMKIGTRSVDLDSIPVEDIMTADPVTLRARSSVADAIREMSDHGFSHVPLLGESGRPVGVTSFRDVAAYLETSLEVLA